MEGPVSREGHHVTPNRENGLTLPRIQCRMQRGTLKSSALGPHCDSDYADGSGGLRKATRWDPIATTSTDTIANSSVELRHSYCRVLAIAGKPIWSRLKAWDQGGFATAGNPGDVGPPALVPGTASEISM